MALTDSHGPQGRAIQARWSAVIAAWIPACIAASRTEKEYVTQRRCRRRMASITWLTLPCSVTPSQVAQAAKNTARTTKA